MPIEFAVATILVTWRLSRQIPEIAREFEALTDEAFNVLRFRGAVSVAVSAYLVVGVWAIGIGTAAVFGVAFAPIAVLIAVLSLPQATRDRLIALLRRPFTTPSGVRRARLHDIQARSQLRLF